MPNPNLGLIPRSSPDPSWASFFPPAGYLKHIPTLALLPPSHTSLTQEPYGLPMSRLKLLTMTPPEGPDNGSLAPVNVLQLFPDGETMRKALDANPRLSVLLLRHLSPGQANQLLGDLDGPTLDDKTVEAKGWEVIAKVGRLQPL